MRSGGNGARHFDIEHHFPFRPIRISRRTVGRAAHGNRGHLRDRNAKLLKISFKIAQHITAPKLNDRNALPLAIYRCGVVVELGDLGREIRDALLGGVPATAEIAKRTNVRLGLGTIIEAKDPLDDAVQLLRNFDLARPASIRATGVFIDVQTYAERRGHGLHRPAQHHRARAQVDFPDLEAVRLREGVNAGEVLGIRAIPGGELLPARDAFAPVV